MTNEWEAELLQFEVTPQQIRRIEESESIFQNLIFAGMAHVWVAKPNGGKTALAIYASAAMASIGMNVFYFQLDASGPQLKDLSNHARDNSYTLLSTLSDGTSDKKIRYALERAILNGDDHSNTVFVLDTLKKFVDVNNKQKASDFYALLRTFTQRGGTVLSLAHANKYKDADDNIVPDGVQDLVNDADNVAILKGFHTPDTLTIETLHAPEYGGKSRAKIIEATFEINKHTYGVRAVDGDSYRDQLSRDERELQDEPVIKAVKDLLRRGEPVNQSQILKGLRICGIGQRKAMRVLKNADYHDYHWSYERGENNAALYALTPAQTVQTSKPP